LLPGGVPAHLTYAELSQWVYIAQSSYTLKIQTRSPDASPYQLANFFN